MDKRLFILVFLVIAIISSSIFVVSQSSAFATSAGSTGISTATPTGTTTGTGTSLTTATATETCKTKLAAQGLTCDATRCWSDLKNPSGEIVGKISSIGDINQPSCAQSGTTTIRITNAVAIGSELSDQFTIIVTPYIAAFRGTEDAGVEYQIPAANGEYQIPATKGAQIVAYPYIAPQP